MARLLLLLPTRTYRAQAFLAAAQQLGVELTVACEESSTLEALQPAKLLTLDFRVPAAAARQAAEFAATWPISAVVGVDDDATVAAAAIAAALALPYHPPAAAAAARNKYETRRLLSKAGVPVPRFSPWPIDANPAAIAPLIEYPCVVKPLALSASRGVIRANDAVTFVAAFRRVVSLLRSPDVAARGEEARQILVEDFVPGVEVALEGLLVGGELQVLALFDKPDPLDGPYFEETIYVTPSRLPSIGQAAIAGCAAAAARALGLREGPVHAELRLNERGPWLIELAPRSIGGLCSRALRFGTGMSLEELILRHALGLEIPSLARERAAAGVIMIPVPGAGVLQAAYGLDAARAVPAIEDVVITAHVGQQLVPLPEGATYVGFIFARGESPQAVEAALREAYECLAFEIDPGPPGTGAALQASGCREQT